ncbi:unannotated protein [freshwater metagenome]|uniref:3-isopropylmalate dehydratase n=1 Tax=freshwater metagenome TaxID=449393 RepID=A0A6J6KZI9_9ZZZZ|nr:3-isopropylmalate dehydratase small subunit [Actinomycetota bacterium]MTA66922.1 3-isopropylmalate dehydratase small subunit [Actinomycetota bacterium]
MEKFTSHTGIAVPLRLSNVDTDQVISSKYLKRVTRTGYEDGLFELWRKDSAFALNQTQYQGASILIAGVNFGIGSSREHAVWALMDYGFKVVISSRFADIFRGNSGKAGLLTIQVDQKSVDKLSDAIEADPSIRVTVDLLARHIIRSDLVIPFQIDDYTRWRLLEGLDDIQITLVHESAISEFNKSRPSWMPQIDIDSA